MEDRSFSPVGSGERVAVLDVLRGLAILGILVSNLEWFRTPELWNGYPGGYEGPVGSFERAYLFAVNFLATGKFVTALSFLFGLGLALQFARARAVERPARGFLARRLGVLAIFGAAHALLVWSGDILLLYAVYGFLFLLFVSRRPRTLVLWTVGIFGAFTILGLALTVVAFLASGGDGSGQPPPVDDLATRAREVFNSGSYPEMVAQRFREYVSYAPLLLLSGSFVFPMMLLGAACANAGVLRDAGRLGRLARRAALWGLAFGIPLNLFYALSYEAGPVYATWYAFLSTTAQYIGAPLMALGWMGLAVLLAPRVPGVSRRLATVGRMALTNYLAQSILMTSIIYGLGIYGDASAALALLLVIGVWALELIWSPLWLSRYPQGPAEQLWRRLSYGRTKGSKDTHP